ncbi:response regulator transcription factor [Priestia koreensis]|uniref:response regulator transcription factor n=1 Tax=Priestia koreensis TaxID=284581 RepID=UPI0028F7444D|nr:response regulator transcription factor [Priestia koreensis]
MWNILLVEDQHIVRQGLKMMIEIDDDFQVVAEASNGEEALAQLHKHIIDMVVMDIRMPIMNGLEATRKIKGINAQMKILILTTFNDDEYALQALKDGANGFMLKDAEPAKLIEAIRSCLNGGLTIHDNVAAKVVPRLLQTPNIQVSEIPLSPRELAVTKLVGEGKTNKEIADELYLSIGTVKNHITQVLNKLELRDRTQLAIYAVRHHLA